MTCSPVMWRKSVTWKLNGKTDPRGYRGNTLKQRRLLKITYTPVSALGEFKILYPWNSNRTVCKIVNGKPLYSTGSSARCSEMTCKGELGRGWEGNPRGRGCVFTYGWFTLLYSRNQHNIVKQLYSNLKKRNKIRHTFKNRMLLKRNILKK